MLRAAEATTAGNSVSGEEAWVDLAPYGTILCRASW